MEVEKIKDFEEGLTGLRKMTYKELVEDMNQDLKALEQIEKPIILFKEEKQEMAERIQKQDESLKKVKRVVYPAWALFFLVNTLLMIGYSR